MKPIDLSQAQLQKIGFLARQRRGNVIDGQERPPADGRYLAVIDPATGECREPVTAGASGSGCGSGSCG